MSNDPSVTAPAAAPAVSPETPVVAAELPMAFWRSRPWAFGVLLLAVLAAVGALLSWQKINHVQEELARRSTDTGTQAMEARTLARQSQEATRELSARLLATETRLNEVSLQRTQLEELMRSLSRSRDDNLVIDLEAGLRLAQQQALLTGSAEPLLAALKSAELRLVRAAQPRLSPVQRAMAMDAERIRSASLTDVPALLVKLDELVRLIDDLPMANQLPGDSAVAAQAGAVETAKAAAAKTSNAAPNASFWSSLNTRALSDWLARTLQGLREQASSLLRVSRIDQPEAALLAPDQAYFLRENIKLKLLNARLALLSRQTDAARSDLAGVQTGLQRYFDGSSRKTQSAIAALQLVQAQLRSGELPRLTETLAALATAAAGR